MGVDKSLPKIAAQVMETQLQPVVPSYCERRADRYLIAFSNVQISAVLE
jgi:hypothetical protein